MTTTVPSTEDVEEARLPVRPRRAGVPSTKLRSADNAAVPALSSHRSAAVPAQGNASHESPEPELANPTHVSLTPATSMPNTPLIGGSGPSPSAPSFSATGRATATGDDDGVGVLAGRTRICKSSV